MSEDETESKILAALAVALAPRHGVGAVPTTRLLETAQDAFGLTPTESILALDRLAQRGRLVERDGEWSLRPSPVRARR